MAYKSDQLMRFSGRLLAMLTSIAAAWGIASGYTLAGFILAALAFCLMAIVTTSTPRSTSVIPASWLVIPVSATQIIMLTVGIMASGILVVLQFVGNVGNLAQALLFFVGVGLFIWGCGHSKWHIRTWGGHLWVLGPIMLVALILRVWHLENGLRILVDETQTIYPIVLTWQRRVSMLRQITPEGNPYAYLYPYVQQVGGLVLGHGLAGLRLFSSITGTLTVGALYVLAMRLFDRPTAALSAGVLACLPIHIHFSRLGIVNIHDPLFATLALAFIAIGISSGDRRAWLLAGGCLGITHYLYEGGRLFHSVFAEMWLLLILITVWLRTRKPDHIPPLVQGLLWMMLTAGVIAAPLYITWIGSDASLFGRLTAQNLIRSHVSNVEGSLEVVGPVARVGQSLSLYISHPDEWLYYGGDQPLIPMFTVPLLVLGLAVSIFNRRRWIFGMLPALWLIMTILAAGLFVWNPTHAARHTIGLPALAMLIALGIRSVTQLAPRQLQAGVAWVMVIILGVGQVVYYFGFHLPLYNQQIRAVRETVDQDDAILRMADLPPNTRSIIISTGPQLDLQRASTLLTYVSGGEPPPFTVIPGETITAEYLANLPRNTANAFFIDWEESDLIAGIRLRYPQLEMSFSADERLPVEYQTMLLFIPVQEPSLSP